jgi:hypothetical protein
MAKSGSADDDKWSPQESRSVRSPWGWRAFLLMSLVFLGVAIILAGNGAGTFAILWVVIAIGWFAASMWLWRQHSRLP